MVINKASANSSEDKTRSMLNCVCSFNLARLPLNQGLTKLLNRETIFFTIFFHQFFNEKKKDKKRFRIPHLFRFIVHLHFLSWGRHWVPFDMWFRYQLHCLVFRVRDDMSHLWHDECVFLPLLTPLVKKKHNNKSFYLKLREKNPKFSSFLFSTQQHLVSSLSEDREGIDAGIWEASDCYALFSFFH